MECGICETAMGRKKHGNLIPQGKGKRPSGMVYERKAEQEQKEEA